MLVEWFALETNRDHSVVFEIASKYCISDSFVDHDGHSMGPGNGKLLHHVTTRGSTLVKLKEERKASYPSVWRDT